MARQVLVNVNNLVLPDGKTYNTGAVVVLTDVQFAALAATALAGPGTIEVTDQGLVADPGDAVVIQAPVVAAPAALTSAVAVAAPTKAEYDALRADVVALRTTLANTLVALKTTYGPMASV